MSSPRVPEPAREPMQEEGREDRREKSDIEARLKKAKEARSVQTRENDADDIREERQEERSREDRPNRRRENRRRSSGRSGRGGVSVREKPTNLVPVEASPVLDFLNEVTGRMGLELTVTATANEECLYFDISGKDSGTIIGKRGQTLDSIQYLASLVANKEEEKYKRVVVDAENYREKRERTLEQLADRLADKVQKTGKSVRLEPMNPYERKVIHATLQRNSAVTTRSEGEEPYRRVIIENNKEK